jgi:ribA/ribD-fused uncharacterized protein
LIDSFRDEFFFLSNFYPSPVFYNGFRWPTAEHAFQSAKMDDIYYRRGLFLVQNPAAAKRIGRGAPALREDWDDVRQYVMWDVVRAKFSHGTEIAERLRYTDPHELVEGNYWHDNYWGVCKCSKCAGSNPSNWLGVLLSEWRKQLIKLDSDP